MNKRAELIEVIAGILIFVFLAAVFFVWAISIVNYNEYAVEREFGTLYQDVKATGFTWVGFGTLQRTNNQVRNYEITIEAASNDYQDVKIILNLNTQIKRELVYDFVKNYLSEETYTQYLNNKVQEKVKTLVLKYSAEEILTKRIAISKELYDAVKDIPELKYFTFNDLTIKDIQFSDKFSEVLERKAQILIEREVLTRQEENLKLLKNNMQVVDIDTYFKYQLIEKWDGKSNLIISDAVLR